MAASMADHLSVFKTPEDAARYVERYDDLVERQGPVAQTSSTCRRGSARPTCVARAASRARRW
jgi:hypothetical protein